MCNRERNRPHTKYAVCPYCGHEDKDSWKLNFGPGTDEEIETECGTCGETFMVPRVVTVDYTTRKIECKKGKKK